MAKILRLTAQDDTALARRLRHCPVAKGVVHRLRELLPVIRLRQKTQRRSCVRTELHDLLRVPRREQHRQARTQSRELGRELRSRELAWKHHIRQKQVDLGAATRERKCRLSVLRVENRVAESPEKSRGELPNESVVFDEQYDLAVPAWLGAGGCGRHVGCRTGGSWEVDLHGRAATEHAVHPDVTT